jgi:hypothetical protein
MKELIYSVKSGKQDSFLGRILDAVGRIRYSGSRNEQLALFTTERQPVLRQAVAFSKISVRP